MIVTKYLMNYKLDTDNNLIINTLSGALDIVDDNLSENLSKGLIPSDPDLITQLKERMHIFENEEEERKTFESYKRFIDMIAPKDSSYTGLVICPTFNCNLRCTYCFQDHEIHDRYELMSFEQVDAAFQAMEDYLVSYSGASDYSIQIFGGEPLQPSTKEIVEYILKKSAQKNKPVSITTNGICINSFYNLLTEYKHLVSLQITLDGSKVIHDKRRIFPNGSGSYDLIVANTERLLKDGFKVRVRMNIDETNASYLKDAFAIVEKLGWNKLDNFSGILSPVSTHSELPTCTTISEFEILQKIKEVFPDISIIERNYKFTLGSDMFRIVGHMNRICDTNLYPRHGLPSVVFCEACLSRFMCMGPDGYIYPCTETLGEPNYSIGTFYPNFELHDDKASQWNNRTIFTLEECSNCNVSNFCGGGCAYAALKFNGNAKTAFCGETRNKIDRFILNKKEDFLNMR